MRFIVLLFCFLPFTAALAQTARDADRLFNDRDYEQAQIAYKKLLAGSPSSVLYMYRYARCCYELGDAPTAMRYFEQAGERYPLRNFYLGNLYFDAYRFAEAGEAWSKYMESLSPDDERLLELAQRVETAELGNRFLARVEDITIVDSVRTAKNRFLDAYRLSPETGKLELRNALYTNVLQSPVSYTNQRGDRVVYAAPTDDGLDLFRTLRLLDRWSEPKKMPAPPNTPYNENFPFVLSDGITLYFASDAPGGMGGYDIYITRYNSETDTYLQPENIGMPFNSPANDYMLVVDEVHQLGWFATDRRQHPDSVMIYVFVPNEATKIVRNSDRQQVADLAALKTYRTAARPALPAVPAVQQPGKTPSAAGFTFYIDDHTVYTRYADFRSKQAAQSFRQYQRAANEFEAQNAHLEALRRTYERATPDQKTALTDSIVNLEQRVLEQQATLENQRITIRNTEIEYLQAQEKQ